MDETFKLCYIEGPWAYFTTQDVVVQWGDDWNDAPYEHNAGSPYRPGEGDDYEVGYLAFEGPFLVPSDTYVNSPYSVQEINKGVVPWLRGGFGYEGLEIWAGTTYLEFVEKVTFVGGRVFINEDKGETDV